MRQFYINILEFQKKHHLDKPCIIISKITPYLVASIYILTLIYLFINHDTQLKVTIIKPALSFIIVTIIRKLYNRPRPCIALNIEPLVGHKTGESFPSRHTVSAFAIALALLHISLPLGSIILFLAILVGLSRILCGVHFVSDVLTAIIIALIISII